MRRVMVILLQEKNLGPNVLYYVFVICLSLKGLPRAIQSIPSKPWRRATRQKYNQWGQKAKICSGIRQKYMLGQTGKNICMGQARGFIKVGPVLLSLINCVVGCVVISCRIFLKTMLFASRFNQAHHAEVSILPLVPRGRLTLPTHRTL